MNWVKRFISSIKNAGSKRGDRAILSKSYTAIDKCDKCPVFAYEDAVFNDNLRALVVEGNPPDEVLIMAKMELMTEFAELSGNKQTSELNSHIRQIYLYQNQIMGYSITIRCIDVGQRNQVVEFLRDNGLPVKKEWDDEALIKKIVAKIKNLEVRLSEALKKYQAVTPKGDTESKGSYFTEQLIEISKHVGYHVSKSIMMSEFALYIKDLQKTINYAKHRNHTGKRA